MKISLVVLALALSFPLVAEGQSQLSAGARVRVTAPSADLERYVTTIQQVRGDWIVVDDHGTSRTLALANVTSMEIRTGTRRQTLRGAAFGLGIGALTGAVAGSLTFEECVPQSLFDCLMATESSSEAAGMGGIIGGVVGAAAGAIVGSFRRTDRWSSIELPVSVAITPMRSGGVRVMMSRAFERVMRPHRSSRRLAGHGAGASAAATGGPNRCDETGTHPQPTRR